MARLRRGRSIELFGNLYKARVLVPRAGVGRPGRPRAFNHQTGLELLGAGGTATKIFDPADMVGLVAVSEVATTFWRWRGFRRGFQAQSGCDATACVRDADA